MTGYGQNSCSSAINHTTYNVEYNPSDIQFWVKFTATQELVNISISKSAQTPSTQIQSLELFSGSCGSLNLISSMNLADSTIFESNLTQGNIYYIKIVQNQAASTYFNLAISLPLSANAPITCQTNCNIVPNGCFDEANINDDLMQYFNNPQVNGWVYNSPLQTFNSIIPNNSYSDVCGWYAYKSSPQLKREFVSGNFNYYLFLQWKTYNYINYFGEWAVSELNNGINLVPDDYILRFKHREVGNMDRTKIYLSSSPYPSVSGTNFLIANEYLNSSSWTQVDKLITITSSQTNLKYLKIEPKGFQTYGINAIEIDNIQILSFNITGGPSTICQGEDVHLYADLCNELCPEDNLSLTYVWSSSPSDASLSGQETQASITVNPNVTTTYTVTATTNMGASITKNKIITVNPTPAIPVFTGDIHTCNGTSNYIISNYDAGATYTCIVYDDNMNPLPGNPIVNGNNFTINWANYGAYQHWTIGLEASYGTGCSSNSTLDVFPCCTNGSTYTDINLSGTFSNTILSFNGTITIASGQTLEINGGSMVYMGGNAEIILEPGATFNLFASTIEACGNNLWNGIFSSDPSSLITIDGSSVFDAKNAIVSINGGDYNLSNVNFDRNYKVLKVEDFTGDHSGKLSNCNFQGAQNLLYPYENSQSKTAIELNDVIMQNELIKIGGMDRSNIIGFENGLQSNNSDFVAFNLDLSECVVGIDILGNDNSSSNRRAIIGSSNPVLNCTFNNMTYMAYALNKTDLYVYNCQADQCAFGIVASHNKESIISILNNTLNSVGVGISINDISSQIFVQRNNVILDIGAFPGSLQAGIQVLDNVNLGSFTPFTYICNNNVDNPRYGIIASNTYDLTIYDNVVNLNNNPSSLALGIIHTNNHESEIAKNRISSPSTLNLNASMIGIRSGIYNNFCDMSLYCSNESYYNGSGFYFAGTNTNAEIGLNRVENNWNGMYFDYADIGPNPQGNAGDPWNNEWTNNMDKNNDGDVFPTVDWYHQGANPFDPTINPFSTTGGIVFQLTNNGSYNCGVKCTNGPINPPGGVTDPEELLSMAVIPPIQPQLSASQWDSVRTNKLNHLLKIYIPSLSTSFWSSKSLKNQLDSINLYPNNTDYYYKKACAIYSYLHDNQQVISLGTKNDFIFSSVYNWLDKSNIGQLKKIENAVFAGDTILSAKLLQSFSPVNQLELMKMEVLQVYNKTWSKGIFHFSSSDSATLYSIAYQNPNQSGSAVYLARNMLGLTLVDFGQNTVAKQSKISQSNTSKASHKPDINVYPNPANELLYIELPEISSDYCIRIYTIFGQEIINVKANSETTLKVDISNLNSGIYIYSIYQDGLPVNNDRFVKN